MVQDNATAKDVYVCKDETLKNFTQKRVGHTDKLNGKMYGCGLQAM